MLVEAIKSRPQYPGLSADKNANHHVFAADGNDAQALIDLLAQHGSSPGGGPD
jgi:hypothetical protein